MTPDELEHEITELEHRLDRLRALYEQYFLGIEKIEPQVARKDVDRRFWALRKIKIRNTARRFKLQTLIQRYNTFQQHWARICREIENGTYRRQLLRAERRAEPTVAPQSTRGAQRASERESLTDLSELMDEELDLAAEAKRALASVMKPRVRAEAPAPTPPAVPTTETHAAAPAPQPRREPKPRPAHAALDALELDDFDLGPAPERVRSQPSPALKASPAPSAVRPPIPARPGAQASRPPIPTRPGAQASKPEGAPHAAGAPPPRPAAAAAPTGARPAPAAPPPARSAPPAVPPRAAAAPPARPATPPGASRPPTPAARPTPMAPTGARPAPGVAARPAPGVAARPAPPLAARPAPGVAARPAHAAPPGARPAPGIPARPAPAAPSAARPPASPSAGRLSDERVSQLHANLVAAKKQLGEAGQVSRGGLQRQLEASMTRLQEKHRGRKIDFEVVVREGKAVVKPKVQ